jgi:sulfate adenylyltransferase
MINPHGGKLVNKVAADSEKAKLEEKAATLFKITISDRYVSDCEMIAIGGFSPLEGFMTRAEAESVINNIQLPNGLLWSIPVVLPVSEDIGSQVNPGDEAALYDKNERLIAIMQINDKFSLDQDNYAAKIYKTTDATHPGVKVLHDSGNLFIGGEITKLINRPLRESISEKYFRDPAETREIFKKNGWKKVVAFQTRNPIHRAHEYLIKCALESVDGVMIHPLVGETKSDDIPADTRMKCYEVLIDNYFNQDRTLLSVLPAAMRYAGPREAIHHMLIRQNYGCTHMIIGRDHAGVGNYYGSYEAQELVDTIADKLLITPIKFDNSFFCKRCENLASQKTCPHPTEEHLNLSGTAVRAMLKAGELLPKQFSRPEVAQILIEWAKGL